MTGITRWTVFLAVPLATLVVVYVIWTGEISAEIIKFVISAAILIATVAFLAGFVHRREAPDARPGDQ